MLLMTYIILRVSSLSFFLKYMKILNNLESTTISNIANFLFPTSAYLEKSLSFFNKKISLNHNWSLWNKTLRKFRGSVEQRKKFLDFLVAKYVEKDMAHKLLWNIIGKLSIALKDKNVKRFLIGKMTREKNSSRKLAYRIARLRRSGLMKYKMIINYRWVIVFIWFMVWRGY